MNSEFEKHEKIVKDFEAKEEARGASAEKGKETSTSPESENQKTKGTQQQKEPENKSDAGAKAEAAEKQAKEDEKILDTPDEKLEEEQKARKKELLDKKSAKEAEKKPDEKKEKAEEKAEEQDRLNKRFGELTGEIKDLKTEKTQDKEKIDKLIKELAQVKEKMEPPKENVEKDAEGERIKKYLDEDKDKPREQRREMSREDLEDWLAEDEVSAHEWIADRSLRRSTERNSFRVNQQKKRFVKDLTDKMEDSTKKVEAKHPELKEAGDRIKQLKEEGKSDKESHQIVSKENEKYRMMFDIMKENPEKYWVENGPELMAEVMEKRLGTKKEGKSLSDEDLEKIREDAKKEALQEEEERRAKLDEGTSSSQDKGTSKSKLSPEMEKKKKAILAKSGLSEEEFEGSIERRKKLGL